MKKFIKFLFLVIIGINCFSLENIDSLMNNFKDKYKIIGLSFIVVKNDSIIYEKYMGKADIERNIDITRNTKYRIASISKTITATALMTLYDDGLIDIDNDISDYLGYTVRNPNFPNCKITLKQLMLHTSSLRDGSGYNNFLNATYGNNPPDIREILLPNGLYYTNDIWSSDYPPGNANGWDYCNLASGVIASIIEKVSGKHFHQFCRERIFQPLGMDACFNDLENISNINDLAVIYRYNNNTPIPQADNFQGIIPSHYNYDLLSLGYNGTIYSPQGGVRCSAFDLAKFMLMHMNYGKYGVTNILDSLTIRLMHQVHWVGNGLGGFYKKKGLQFHITDDLIPGVTMIGHSGEAYGLISDMYFSENYDFGFIFIINGGKYNSDSNLNGFYDMEDEIIKNIGYDIIVNNFLSVNHFENNKNIHINVYPNPFNPATTINYEISKDDNITLIVYNVKGEIVKTLINTYQVAGKYSIIWDGKDNSGKSVGSGIYFYKLKAGNKEISNKMVLLK